MSLESWFKDLNSTELKYKLIFFTGSCGSGKKYKLRKLSNKYNVNMINVNPLYNKAHTHFPKKVFLEKLVEISTKQNIDSFFKTSKDVIVIHNLHIFDKAFFEKMSEIKANIVIPIICLLNTSLMSERFQSYVLRNAKHFSHRMSFDFILSYVKNELELFNLILNDDEINGIVKTSKGNLIHIRKKIIHMKFISKDTRNTTTIKIDKYIVENSFKNLCDKSQSWLQKTEIIRSQSSLFRMLMPKHICNGLDKDNPTNKIDIAIDCFEKIKKAEHVRNFHYATILKYIYPALRVGTQTIKIISLTPSFVNKTERISLSNEEKLFELYYIKESIKEDEPFESSLDLTNFHDQVILSGKIFKDTISKKSVSMFQKKYMCVL